AGAASCDEATRVRETLRNPAALLALAWYQAGGGRGRKAMVVLPYKDRLLLLGRYLQQLVMESLGKRLDLAGRLVEQGLTVYGNKGSTDQHAYVQQLREGVHNFFVTFVQVLEDRHGPSMTVEEDVTSGDYLLGFLLGTRRALFEKDRESITLTLRNVSPRTIGTIIALYERAVGFYASLVNVNAYHQPGVEAGKKAAGAVIAIQRKLLDRLLHGAREPRSAEELAADIGERDEVETVFKLLEHLAAQPDRGIVRVEGRSLLDARFHAR
ncbi:MAG: glucose-6-phosphate isomerase, partial [Candidatus Binatia bacterium]